MTFEIAKKSIKTKPEDVNCDTYTQLKGWPIVQGVTYKKDELFKKWKGVVVKYQNWSTVISRPEDIDIAISTIAYALVEEFVESHESLPIVSEIKNYLNKHYKFYEEIAEIKRKAMEHSYFYTQKFDK